MNPPEKKYKLDRDTAKKSLKNSFIDGIFAAGMTGITQDFFTPFLLFLGGGAREVGLLNSLPNIIASFSQLMTERFTKIFKSRMRLINLCVLLQSASLYALAAISFFKIGSVSFFIALAVLFTTFGALGLPAWGSIMSDTIPEDKRGKYFGWRNSILGPIIVISSLAAGIFLYFTDKPALSDGFAVIFAAAAIFRTLSWVYLRRMADIEFTPAPRSPGQVKNFISRMRESSFARFVILVSLLNFSVNLAGPYFVVLMINDLKFNYFEYSVVVITAPLIMYLMMKRWGRLADAIGNVRVIKFTAPIITIIPMFWLISVNPVVLVCSQIISGFAWAGFNLSASNFIFDAVESEKRVRYISYFNVINGLMLSAGALIGGSLLHLLPKLMGYSIFTLFVISTAARLCVSVFIIIKLKEVRRVDNVSSNNIFFSMIGVKPLLGIDRKTIRYE